MKKVLLSTIIFLFSVSVHAQVEVGGSADGKPSPKLWMETNTYNFGIVPLGTPVSITFEIKNTGNAPLSITKAEPSCQCTLVDYTKTNIAPGETGFVKATYDAAIMGKFDKRIFLFTNAYEGEMDLILKGEVIYMKDK